MRIFLAPMEGVVDHHMRRTLFYMGNHPAGQNIDLCVTEFIRVTNHTLPRRVFIRACPELLDAGSIPVRVQLLGSNPQSLASNARKAARLGAPAIDLNFGCPARTVNKNRGGASLLNEPALLHDIVRSVREAVPAHIPVTAKMRLGYADRTPYLTNACAIEDAGADELVVHARSKTDGYHPPAYWEYIADIRKRLTIPVIANGEIWTPADYRRCKQVSGCTDVMLGRGLLAMPDLAASIKASECSAPYKPRPWKAIAGDVHNFFLETCDSYPKKFTGNRLKQWLHYLKKNYPQADRLFADIKLTRDKSTILERLEKEL